MIKLIGLGFFFCLGVAWIIGILKNGHECDVEMRRQILLKRASELWPQLDMCAALDCLYAQTLRQIKADCAADKNTDDLQDDLYAIMNERNRLFTQEDSQIAIHIIKQS